MSVSDCLPVLISMQCFPLSRELPVAIFPDCSGKDGKPDSWFLFDLYKRKGNPVTKVQELIPEMSHISHENV